MAINVIKPISPISGDKLVKKPTKSVGKNAFDDILQKSMNDINDNLNLANDHIDNILKGSDEDFHKYIIDAQKTEISFQLTMQIRNKVVDAYKEIMRMQV